VATAAILTEQPKVGVALHEHAFFCRVFAVAQDWLVAV